MLDRSRDLQEGKSMADLMLVIAGWVRMTAFTPTG
jgi:hypothetical protein